LTSHPGNGDDTLPPAIHPSLGIARMRASHVPYLVPPLLVALLVSFAGTLGDPPAFLQGWDASGPSLSGMFESAAEPAQAPVPTPDAYEAEETEAAAPDVSEEPEPATSDIAAAPITGTLHTVWMIGDGNGYRFEPADIVIESGDGITFEMVSGGPHNVAFDPSTVGEARAALLANMPDQAGELSGTMLLDSGQRYTISFTNVPPGTYDYYCTPHLAMNMKGRITVRP
jgi:plastocyanin